MSLEWWRGKFRYTVGVALALLAGAALAPSPARAGCGDYVMIGTKGHAIASHSDPATGSVPAPARTPCSGPMCSQNSIPFSPAPSTAPVEEERWAFPLTLPV